MNSHKTAAASLVVTDLDGTLLRDDKTVSSRDLVLLETAKQAGSWTAIATGRSLYSFNKIMMSLKKRNNCQLPVDFVVFSTGAGIMTFPDTRIMRARCLDPEDVVYIVDVFDRFRFDYMVHHPIPDTNLFAYRRKKGDNPDFDARIRLYQSYARPLDGMISGFGSATQLLAVIPKDRSLSFMEPLRNRLAYFSLITATSPLDRESIWLEVFHREVSKSLAVKWLCQKLAVSRDHVAAIGNDYNDQDLLAWAGHSYVVDNAPDILKQEFRPVPSNNNSGVAYAIDDFLSRTVI